MVESIRQYREDLLQQAIEIADSTGVCNSSCSRAANGLIDSPGRKLIGLKQSIQPTTVLVSGNADNFQYRRGPRFGIVPWLLKFHFILYVVDMLTLQVYVLNSFKKTAIQQKAQNDFNAMLSEAFGTAKKKVISVTVPAQGTNTNSCGLHVICHGIYLSLLRVEQFVP